MTAMSGLASTTVHCARCHNHKFDPIPQEDYYSLQAVFAGVDGHCGDELVVLRAAQLRGLLQAIAQPLA